MIRGTVFQDLDGSGLRDSGEPGLPNWVIELGGQVTQTVLTDAEGNFAFTGLPAGSYTVCQAQALGIQSVPLEGVLCPAGLPGYAIDLAPPVMTRAALQFGNWPL